MSPGRYIAAQLKSTTIDEKLSNVDPFIRTNTVEVKDSTPTYMCSDGAGNWTVIGS